MEQHTPPLTSAQFSRLAHDFGEWLHPRTDGLTFSAPTEPEFFALKLFHLALEHFDAIIVLMGHRHVGSAIALTRPLYEACLRGCWILASHNAKVLNAFKKESVPKVYNLLKDLADANQPAAEALAGLHQTFWTASNSFTHGGIFQSESRFSDGSFQSAYPRANQEEFLCFAIEVAIIVASEIFSLSRDESLLEELGSKAKELRSEMDDVFAQRSENKARVS